MTEAELQRKVLQMIRKEFPDVWVYKTHDICTMGIPDLLCCQDGHLVAIELKRPGHDYTKDRRWPLQKYIIDKINAHGGRACVCQSVEDVRKFLTERR